LSNINLDFGKWRGNGCSVERSGFDENMLGADTREISKGALMFGLAVEIGNAKQSQKVAGRV
jgi:hypothetical protein